MKQPRKLKGSLEILLVIGIILIIPLFFVINSLARPQAANATATQIEITGTPLGITAATAVAPSKTTAVPVVARGKQPPACIFPLAQITAAEAKPEQYTFSEPQVVLTDPDNLYDIVEWLPDNQRVLMTQDLYNITNSIGDKLLKQSIELYNPTTDESSVYAIRHHIDSPPSWQPRLNAVVYPDMNFLGFDENTHLTKFTRQVWVSYGNPDTAKLLADNLPQFPLAVKPGGNAMVYISEKNVSQLDSSMRGESSIPFDLTQWDYASGRRNENPVSYEMAWQPSTAIIFLYSNGGMQQGGGYTFILNTNTGQVCELSLGGWAVRAHWSSDGRYLAIIRAEISFNPVNETDLVVLDIATGRTFTAAVTRQDNKGNHFVDDFVWAPDNRHLLAIGSVIPLHSSRQAGISGLYLVDFLSGQSDNLLQAYTFYANTSQNNLAWSPDGSKLLVRCPTVDDERVCFISVKIIGQ